MTDFVFITGNQNKADYLAKWLDMPIAHQKIELDEIQSLDLREVVERKAREAYKHVQRPVLVEDVALSFGALGGRLPGTLVKWFLTEIGCEGMLRMLQGFDDRSATASIMYGLFDGEKLHTFEAHKSGAVPTEARHSDKTGWQSGLSWNSIFIPEGADKTYAEMTDEELWPYSHRAAAITQLKAFLQLHS